MPDLKAIAEAVIKGETGKVKELVQAALNDGTSVDRILNEGLLAGMAVVGELFGRKEIYVPEVLLAARSMHAGMEFLEPLLASAGVEPVAKVVLGTVKGDYHDIGKNLVGIMLRGAGFEVIDLGVDVPPPKFVDAAKEEGAKIIGMSCLLQTSTPFMQTTIETLEAAGLKGQIKTMVGGAVISPSYASKIGADGYAPDASLAVDKAKVLLGLKEEGK